VPKSRLRPGLRRPCWGAYSAPPDPLAGFKRPTSKGGAEHGREEEEREGKGRGREWKRGKGRERVIAVLRALGKVLAFIRWYAAKAIGWNEIPFGRDIHVVPSVRQCFLSPSERGGLGPDPQSKFAFALQIVEWLLYL